MTTLERNVKQTQTRLSLNHWFATLGWCLLGAAASWSLVVVVDRLFALDLPLFYILGGFTGVVLLTSLIWARAKRLDNITAAATLDAAAGLKERTSSSLFFLKSKDPFARAVIEDAEHFSRRVSVRSFIKFTWPSSLSFASAALAIALLVTLLPIRPIQASDGNDSASKQETFAQKEVKRVRSRLQRLQQQAKKNSQLAELQNPLKTISELPVEKLDTPVSIRREAIKKIDRWADAVKKTRDEKSNKLKQLKRMFRGLKATKQPDNPTERLSKALSKGDFKAAQDAVKELREQLAKMAQKSDPQQRKEMQKQIENLSKQLEQLAQQQEQKQQLQKELEKSGINKEMAKRALENLTKADLQKIKDQMKEQGAGDRQINEMMKKLHAQKQAGQQGSDLAQAVQQAAQAMRGDSSMSDAAAQLSLAGDMLNAMEQLDQQVGELQSMLADAQDAQNEMSDAQNGFCDKCGGGGCKSCGGTGQKSGGGMGRLGRGRGGRAPEQETSVRFKKQRTPVITGKGSIIGKMFIDGEQVRGDLTSEAVEVFSAAEREATDALNKNTIPNQYRSAIKNYFSQFRRELQHEAPSENDEQEATQSDSQTAPDPD